VTLAHRIDGPPLLLNGGLMSMAAWQPYAEAPIALLTEV
jgi:hypothetical protein